MDRDILAFVVITATFICIITFLIGVWSSHFFEYFGRICFCKCRNTQSSTSVSTRSPNVGYATHDFPATDNHIKSVNDMIEENKKNVQ